MSTSFLAALDAEIAQLQEELRIDVRFARLEQLLRLRPLYRSQVDASGRSSGLLADVPRAGGRRPSPVRTQAIEAVASYLKGRTEPTATAELFDHLISLGIRIGGAEPRNNLSAMLSNSGRFRSLGRAGWVLDENDALTEEARRLLGKVADDAAARLKLASLTSIAELPANAAIPMEFDSNLLGSAKALFGRELNSEERRELRRAFRSAVSDLT